MTCKKHFNKSGFTLIEIIAAVVIVAALGAMMITILSDSLVKSSDSLKRLLTSSDLSKVMANIMADYSPYPRWKATTSYSATNPPNKILPTGMNGRFYVCKATTGDSKSGTSEPQWRDSGDTQDGNVTWKTGIWVKQAAYAVGDIVIPTNPNGHFYRCTIAGTSGTTEPLTWPLTGYTAITDGQVTWKRLLGYINEQVGTPDQVNKKYNYGQTGSSCVTNNNCSSGSICDNGMCKITYYVIENRFVKFVSNTLQPISTGEPENVLEIKIKNDEGEILTALFTAKEN